jgi:hypothetical protein
MFQGGTVTVFRMLAAAGLTAALTATLLPGGVAAAATAPPVPAGATFVPVAPAATRPTCWPAPEAAVVSAAR